MSAEKIDIPFRPIDGKSNIEVIRAYRDGDVAIVYVKIWIKLYDSGSSNHDFGFHTHAVIGFENVAGIGDRFVGPLNLRDAVVFMEQECDFDDDNMDEFLFDILDNKIKTKRWNRPGWNICFPSFI